MKHQKYGFGQFLVWVAAFAVLFTVCTLEDTETLGKKGEQTYTVTFNKNNTDEESTEANPQTKKVTTPAENIGTLPTNPKRPDYAFFGWNTKADNTGTNFTATTPVTGDITVYAQWVAITTTTYTVIFDSKGGSAVSPQNVEHGGTASRPNNPTRSGYTFDNWYSNSGLTTVYNFSTTVTDDITLYAKWNPNTGNTTTYTVTFNANGASGTAPDSQEVDAGYGIWLPGQGDLKKDGYTFGGWNTSASGTVTVTSPYTPDGNITLYAVWTPPAKTLTSIALNIASVKNTYTQGETLNLSGLVVTASYSDGSSAVVTNYTANPVNGDTLNTTGTITITVSYSENSVTRTASFTVTVNVGNSADNPFIVNSVDALRKVGTGTDGWTLAAYYKQTLNIDLDSIANWTPIGDNSTSSSRFTGSYDGGGYTIQNLTISGSLNYQGLFGYVGSGGTVKNVKLASCDITGTNYVGGVVGANYGIVENCYTSGGITGIIPGGNYAGSSVGGVVGSNSGTVENCYAVGNIIGDNSVGGVVGYNSGIVEDCNATGNIIGSRNVGGVVGRNYNGTVENCYATGDITGDYSIGGVVGNNSGIVENCYATGDIGNYYYIGGVVGWNEGTVENCYASGGVTGSRNVGGVVGYNTEDTVVENCYASGGVTGVSDVGGVVGYNSGGTVKNCYDIGNVSGSGSWIGGVVGNNNGGSVKNCYTTGNVSGAGTYYVGGVVGRNSGIVENCSATGNVSSGSGTYSVGGVVGANTGTVENCYAIGGVTGGNYVGGVLGDNSGTVGNCYATGNITGGSPVGGVVGRNFNGTLENCVALNATITRLSGTSSEFGRVVGSNNNAGTLANNYARSNMTFSGITVTVTSDANGTHGASITSTNWASSSWWTGTAGWSTSVWNFSGIGTSSYPQLRNMP